VRIEISKERERGWGEVLENMVYVNSRKVIIIIFQMLTSRYY
jgi:hypothetical protein